MNGQPVAPTKAWDLAAADVRSGVILGFRANDKLVALLMGSERLSSHRRSAFQILMR